MKRNALGRGLGALIREPEALVGTNPTGTTTKSPEDIATGQAPVGGAPAGGAPAGQEPVEAVAGQIAAEHEPGQDSGQAVTGAGAAAAARRAPASGPGFEGPRAGAVAASFAGKSFAGGLAGGRGGRMSGTTLTRAKRHSASY
jgi:hypothetical protein